MNKFLKSIRSAVFLISIFPILASATSIYSAGVGYTRTMTDLGSFEAGTYSIRGYGVVDLGGPNQWGWEMTMNPDGTPAKPVTWPQYAAYNPNGSTSADGLYGPAGSSVKIGALIGSLSQNPTQPSDWFLIGHEKTITLTSSRHIYASINDTYYANNVGSFEVTVSSIPEPTNAALYIISVALMLPALLLEKLCYRFRSKYRSHS